MARAKTSSTARLYSLSRGETSELRLGWGKKSSSSGLDSPIQNCFNYARFLVKC